MTAKQIIQGRFGAQVLFSGLALLQLGAVATAGDPTPERAWLDEYANETYWDYQVSIGYYGSRVLSDTGWIETKTRLYSTSEVSDIAPIWQSSSSTDSLNRAVASADEADIHVVLRQEQLGSISQRKAHLEVLDSSSSTPIISWYFPEYSSSTGVNQCDVSPDGRWVVAAADAGTDTHVVVFDLASSTPHVPVLDILPGLFGDVGFVGISENGSVMYLASRLQGRIMDVATGATLHSENYFYNTRQDGHSFARNGSTFARPNSQGVMVSRMESGSYASVGDFTPFPSGSSTLARITAIDSRGETLVAAFYNTPDYQVVEVFAWDIESGNELLHDTYTGSGTKDNLPSGIEISDDGNRFAVSVWGDGAQSVPEVTVYERNPQNGNFQLLTQFDLSGSVGGLAISADGRRLACSGRNSHFNDATGTKFVASYDLGADFTVSGLPLANSAVTFEFYPQTGPHAFLLVSPFPANQQLTFGQVGTLYLDRASLSWQSMGGVDANGVAQTTYALPSSMAGQTLYFQGLSGSPRRLSDSWIPLQIQ